MSQTVTTYRALDIIRSSYDQVTIETIAALIKQGELRCNRVGSVDRVPLEDVTRLLESWRAQERWHVQ